MTQIEVRSAEEAVPPVLTEHQVAEWRRGQGGRVVHHDGHYWMQVRAGFFQPVNWVEGIAASHVTRPTPLCWGYRAALSPSDTQAANASMPVHLLEDVKGYDVQSFSSKWRYRLRQSLRRIEIVELLTPRLLWEQGHDVTVRAAERTGYHKVLSLKEYRASLKALTDSERRLLLAGIAGDRLCGYAHGYALGEVGYLEEVYVAKEYLPKGVNLGMALVFSFVRACRSTGILTRVVNGLHTPEDPALCDFKSKIGFKVVALPSKARVNTVAARYLRARRPMVYYRLTGELDGAMDSSRTSSAPDD